MRWQARARLAVAVIGVACAVAIYVWFGDRAPESARPPLPPIEAGATAVMGEGSFIRRKDGREAIRIDHARRSTFEDGRVLFERARVRVLDRRAFTVSAERVETHGTSSRPDDPGELQLTGGVRFVTDDGLEAEMDRATLNETTRILTVPGIITFRKGRLTGRGRGATYDETRDVLSMTAESRVAMAPDAAGRGGVEASSDRLVHARPERRIDLDGGVAIVREGDTLAGDRATLRLVDDESRLSAIALRGNAAVRPGSGVRPAVPPRMDAAEIDLALHDDGETVRRATLATTGGLSTMSRTGIGQAASVIAAGSIDMDLAAADATLTRLDARRTVTVTLPPTVQAPARTIRADTLEGRGSEGRGLTAAEFGGRPVRFEEEVLTDGRRGTRVVTSERLALQLGGAIEDLERAVFSGSVALTDPSGTAGADAADYDAAARTMRLGGGAGAPASRAFAQNADRTVEARTIDLVLGSNDLGAAGDVVTRIRPEPPAPGTSAPPLFGGTDPILGLGATVAMRGDQATYTGATDQPARLRQGRSLVTGDTVSVDRVTNDLRASGRVEAVMVSEPGKASGRPGATLTEYRVTGADALEYVHTRRVASFSGMPARLRSGEDVVEAGAIRLTFAPEASAVSTVVWEGQVAARLAGGRRGVGARLRHDVDRETFELTGAPAQVLQPAAGSVACTLASGDRLVFNRTSDTAEGVLITRADVPCDAALPYKGNDQMATVRTKGLTKAYSGRTVVRGIDLDVSSGEIVGLLGPNGAGKTTTFGMVVGLVGADAGQVLLEDRDVTTEPMYARARLGIGYLPQEPSVFRGLTVEQNILAILETRGLGRAARRARLAELLDELHLAPLARARAHTLSGGERRRVEITRALATEPKFMLLDEPFSGIDPIAVGEIQRIIFHLRDRGIGLLITDHNVRETLRITDRAYIVHDGAIFRSGTPETLASDEDVKAIYLGAGFRLD